jgi:hypothetical protein
VGIQSRRLFSMRELIAARSLRSFVCCCCRVSIHFRLIRTNEQTETRHNNQRLDGFSGYNPIGLMICGSFSPVIVRADGFHFLLAVCTNENRSTTSGSELVVGQQIGRSYVHWHVGECRPECPGDSATSTPSPARHFTVPGVQLLWRPQQHADLYALPDHRRPVRTTTTTSASQPTTTATTTEHDRLQRSTRSQS